VAQLYPQTLGTHFSRLLRHAWVTVGLFFNPGHHTGHPDLQPFKKSALRTLFMLVSVVPRYLNLEINLNC
jgi:hypothetical protein